MKDDAGLGVSMLRVLHTSDWHLGRKLHRESLTSSHEKFLKWLYDEVLVEHKPDLIVVSGDIYDRGVPPTDAIELFEDALAEIHKHGTKVLITSGNHDSRVRLGSNTRFMAGLGLHFRTRLNQITDPVVLDSEEFTLLAYGIPYLEPDIDAGQASHQWQVDQSQTGVLQEAMRRIHLDIETRKQSLSKPIRVLVASHAFVQGATGTESERNMKDVKVGGLGQADANVFAGVDYVALGHIHRPHINNEIKGPDSTILRYSGSPIPFSFSERSDKKQVLLVPFTKDGVQETKFESLHTPQIRGIQQFEGVLEDILSSRFPETDDWIKIVLTDKTIPPNVFATLKRKFPHLLDLDHQSEWDVQTMTGEAKQKLSKLTEEEVIKRFVNRVTGEEPSEAVKGSIDECCSEVRVEISQVNK